MNYEDLTLYTLNALNKHEQNVSKYLTLNSNNQTHPFYYSIITINNMQQKIPQETPDWTEEQIQLAELAEELRDQGKLDN